MKKVLVAILLMSLSFASIKVQGQVSELGFGVGAGIGKKVIPMVLEVGLEGMTYSASYPMEGSYNDDVYGKVNYDGTLGLNTTRVGFYFKFTTPIASQVPVVGCLLSPVLHVGTQQINAGVDGSVRLAGMGDAFADNTTGSGTYAMIGFPSYFGPVYIEPAFGTQHIALDKVGDFKDLPTVQLAIGVSF